MRCDHDGFAVLDERLEALQPVGARPFETINSVRTFTREIPRFSFIRFERPVEFPSFVGGIEIVRRDENLEAAGLRGLEDALHVRDGTYLPQTLVDRWPRESFLAEHLILRVDKDYRGVTLVDFHISLLIAATRTRQIAGARPWIDGALEAGLNHVPDSEIVLARIAAQDE